MLVIAIGRMGLLQLKKNNSIKHKNNRAGFFLKKKRVLFCYFKTIKHMFFLKKTFVLKHAHISRHAVTKQW